MIVRYASHAGHSSGIGARTEKKKTLRASAVGNEDALHKLYIYIYSRCCFTIRYMPR